MPRPFVIGLASAVIAGLLPVSAPIAQQADVSFFVAGKVARYQQDARGALSPINYMFFAEVFLTKDGKAWESTLEIPGGDGPGGDGTEKALEYRHSESPLINDVMYLSGAADSKTELDETFPNGEYKFRFKTSSGNITNGVASFIGARFPKQPVITFVQDGRAVSVLEVDASKDLVVTWTPFSEGHADPNGILDDLIFVAVDSCTIEDMVHSGRPFEGTKFLTFADTDFRISAGTLEPGQTYKMYVEHARLAGTHRVAGIPAFATFAASTYMDFVTLGKTTASSCPKDP